MTSSAYTSDYFSAIDGASRTSAEIVAPLVMDLLHPQSVVDVGCGTAAWAAAFKRCGVRRVLGIDGNYVDPNSLAISANEFLAADLTRPLAIDGWFDLAVALEVAEHLPLDNAGQFVRTLSQLAPAVLFSAAIPYQGGENHVNEQWPEFWVELFSARAFVAFDVLRPALWSNPAVQWWYAQNLLLLVDREHVSQFPRLQSRERQGGVVPALVHPGCFLHLAWRNRVLEAMLELVKATPGGARIVVADQALFGKWPEIDRQILPFTERDGVYNGPPLDSQAAIGELHRQRDRGANVIAFAWPAFWWLDHYVVFTAHLHSRFREILRSENWIAFDLKDPATSGIG
jgi:SAM-dependent methyltransferase